MDNAGDAIGAFFLGTGALWQVLALVVLIVAAYAVLSMTIGWGVGALTESIRRRRAATLTADSPKTHN